MTSLTGSRGTQSLRTQRGFGRLSRTKSKYQLTDQANGQDWSKQRRLTAPSFNEQASNKVWDISVEQAKSVVNSSVAAQGSTTNSLRDDVRKIALQVLMGVGFGLQDDLEADPRLSGIKHSMSYSDALRTILENIVFAFAASPGFLTSWIMPKRLKDLGYAMQDFVRYNHALLDNEQKAVTNNEKKVTLLHALVKASGSDASSDVGASAYQTDAISAKARLTDEEILGNMFIFNLAGHDTSANTLCFAIGLLSTHPQWQDWIREEIRHVFSQSSDYEHAYPRLKRCQAVMVSHSPSSSTSLTRF